MLPAAKGAAWSPGGLGPPKGICGQERSVVQRIRDEFEAIAGPGGDCVSVEDLARYWERLAEDDQRKRGLHRLGAPEKRAVALRVVKAADEVDLQNTGSVRLEHWVHYRLLQHAGAEPQQVNVPLRRALLLNARLLVELQEMFQHANVSETGCLSFAEIASMYAKKVWRLRPGNPTTILTDSELDAAEPEKLAYEIVQAMSLDGDNSVTYAEFMAYCAGRRKSEVLLYMYDLTNGVAKPLSPWIVGDVLEGVWHTGVVVYGKEYYYSKDTVFANPGETSFGTPERIVHLGSTLWRQDELHEFVSRELKPVFQRETYDVVRNNCNHFSDRVCMFLVRKHVPEEVLRQPDRLLQSNSVSMLRPALNWYLRDRIVERESSELPPGKRRLGAEDHVPPGQFVRVHAADGEGASFELAQVCLPPAKPHWEKAAAPPAPAGLSLAACGAGSLLWGACGLGQGAADSADGEAKLVWVKFFDAAWGGSTPSACRARVCTEQVPRSRLSLAPLGPGGAPRPPLSTSDGPLSWPSGASRGTLPRRVPAPVCMSDEARSPPASPAGAWLEEPISGGAGEEPAGADPAAAAAGPEAGQGEASPGSQVGHSQGRADAPGGAPSEAPAQDGHGAAEKAPAQDGAAEWESPDGAEPVATEHDVVPRHL